jgi:hypothetical protein
MLKEGHRYHMEFEGCIVNVTENLTDLQGRKVTHVEIIPDVYAGENKWKVFGCRNNRVIQLKTIKG